MSMKAMSAKQLKKLFKKDGLEFHLKENKLNGVPEGGSGFIQNTVNGNICYVDGTSANGIAGIWSIMYREAKSLKDYAGGHNRWAETDDELKRGVFDVLGVSV